MKNLELEMEIDASDRPFDRERVSLVFGHGNTPIPRKRPGMTQNRKTLLSIVGAAVLLILLAISSGVLGTDGNRPPVRYQCPRPTSKDGGKDSAEYKLASQEILYNVTAYLENFRNVKYDDWGRTFEEVKAKMYDWKSKQFNVPDGGTIFESACGIGLNLFMTLEILEEAHGTKGVTVYGNEFVHDSVKVARVIADNLPGEGRRGMICQGDSSSMAYVPSNSFDTVFSGYITPLADPLDLGLATQAELDAVYMDLCESTDPTKVQKREKAQRRQEEWYESWVSEMVRIAKPGGTIIIESVSYPLCEARFDWGGVNRDFFYEKRWNVDPGTIFMDEDLIMKRRYHVKMKKMG